MAKAKFPLFDIHDQRAARISRDVLTIDRFGAYLSVNPHLHGPHRHSFYHLVYFSKGKGSQLIDFLKFPVGPGTIYFMNPSQVHQWFFDTAADGYIVNFSPTYFEQVLMRSELIHRFPFFSGQLSDHVIRLSKPMQQKVTVLFESMLSEQQQVQPDTDIMVASLLVQLFVTVQRATGQTNQKVETDNPHQATFRKFLRMVEQHYTDKRLPKDYASLLFVTPHQLNAICHDVAGISSGEVVRNRVVLEAKRLLVNLGLSVEEIADRLNFADTSYFIKFFRKYTGETPESFRQVHYK